MAYYCVAQDVIDELPLFGSQDRIDADDVTGWLSQPYNKINSRMARFYTVPFDTGDDTPPMIHDIAVLLLTAKVLRTIFYSEAPKGPQNARATKLEKDAETLMKALTSDDPKMAMVLLDVDGVEIEKTDSTGTPWGSTVGKDKAFPLFKDEWDDGPDWEEPTDDGKYI